MPKSKRSTPASGSTPTLSPNPDSLPPLGRQSHNSSRSLEACLKKADISNFDRLTKLIKILPVIRINKTLDQIRQPSSEKTKKTFEAVVQNLENASSPARCTSAIYVDADEKPILYYFGRHLVYGRNNHRAASARLVSQEDQYKGQTLAELENLVAEAKSKNQTISIYHDGLKPQRCETYLAAAQSLIPHIKLHPLDATRHLDESMSYEKEVESSDMAIDEDAEESLEINQNAYAPSTEDAGLVHLVHAWIQQNQKNHGLFISRDITRTSTSVAICQSYYSLTQDVAATIGQTLRATFPEYYKKYMSAFNAGVFLRDDPGPFLGRAIIYKLQGRLHQDRHDMGPSISFGVGNYTGGEMILPQLNLKLLYAPGDLVVFFSSEILHKVARFTPEPQTLSAQRQNLMPGRIGTVFFFPKASFELLHDKPPFWGIRSAYGLNQVLFDKIYEKKDNNEKMEE